MNEEAYTLEKLEELQHLLDTGDGTLNRHVVQRLLATARSGPASTGADWVQEAHEHRKAREAAGRTEARLRELLLDCSEFLPMPATLRRDKYGRELRSLWARMDADGVLRHGNPDTNQENA